MGSCVDRVKHVILGVALSIVSTGALAQDLIVVGEAPPVEIEVGEATLRKIKVHNRSDTELVIDRIETSATPTEESEAGLTAVDRAENEEARDGIRAFGFVFDRLKALA